MKNSKAKKITALAVSAALVTSTVGYVSYNAGLNKAVETAAVVAQANTDTKELVSKEISATTTDALKSVIDEKFTVGKEETVYVLANADGSVKKVIVSDWLKNPDNSATIEDKSELQDIENTKGEQTYSINKNNMQVWDANGEDIYFQGTTDKALPVDVSISYKLDGQSISADELAGKSGKLTMRFDYKNNESQQVDINGKKETIYVPFVMVSGMIVDDTVFKNITVSNGKLINDGDRSVIMGFAMPGLQESLGIDASKYELPSYIEINADVTDFELTTTMTIATNEMFNMLNLDSVSSVEDLQESLKTLSDSSKKLVDGSSALYTGLETLLNKSGDLVAGVSQLYTGAGTLSNGAATLSNGSKDLAQGASELKDGTTKVKDGAKTLDDGAIALKDGINQLNDGLKKLSSNSATLNGGAKQVFESLLATAQAQLAASGLQVETLTIDNYKRVLTNAAGSLSEKNVRKMAYNQAYATVSAAVNAQKPTIEAGVTAVVRENVASQVVAGANLGITYEEYKQAVEAGQIDAEVVNQINATVDAQMATDQVKDTIAANTNAKIEELINQQMQSADVQNGIEAAVAQAKAGAGSINSLIDSLDSYKTFYDGVLTYTNGVDQAYAGSKKLVSGSKQLANGTSTLKQGTKNLEAGAIKLKAGATTLNAGAVTLAAGAATLYSGTGTLKAGVSTLIEGETKLFEGSKQISEGMSQFDEEGIQKIVNIFDGDISAITERLKAIVKVSKDYQSYGGKSDAINGTVKFIYRTDSIIKSNDEE